MNTSSFSLNVSEVKNDMLPSVAYKLATDSAVYRPSELMFGSLLASYILGFIGLVLSRVALINPTPIDPSGFFVLALYLVQYVAISITFAYLTAGFYLTYHAGILTMHHMPLENLRSDFLLALIQALAFGVSMLAPVLFPIVIGLNLILAYLRQVREHRRHTRNFYEDLKECLTGDLAVGGLGAGLPKTPQPARRNLSEEERKKREAETRNRVEKEKLERIAFSAFREKFVELVQGHKEGGGVVQIHEELSVWKPMKRSMLWVAGLSISIGLGLSIWYFQGLYGLDVNIPIVNVVLPLTLILVALVNVSVTAPILVKVRRILKDRAKFLYKRDAPDEIQMNREFAILLGDIKQYWYEKILAKKDEINMTDDDFAKTTACLTELWTVKSQTVGNQNTDLAATN